MGISLHLEFQECDAWSDYAYAIILIVVIQPIIYIYLKSLTLNCLVPADRHESRD